jgi:hypothetical protein
LSPTRYPLSLSIALSPSHIPWRSERHMPCTLQDSPFGSHTSAAVQTVRIAPKVPMYRSSVPCYSRMTRHKNFPQAAEVIVLSRKTVCFASVQVIQPIRV